MTWFDVGDPGVFGSPGSFSLALAYGAPDPSAPEGVGNLGNFIYVGTQTGQIYVTQDGGGNGTSNNWINISAGLDGEAVKAIITDPIRGSHDAYAVTTDGVFYMANSIASATNPTRPGSTSPATSTNWRTPSSARPTTRRPTPPTGQATTRRSPCPRSWPTGDTRSPSTRPTPAAGYHPVLYVGAGRLPAATARGCTSRSTTARHGPSSPTRRTAPSRREAIYPHVPVTDLDVSLGNIDTNTGMPSLAGPYQTFVFYRHTDTNGSDVRHGHQHHDRPGRRGHHHRHRHPGRDDDPVRQQFDQTSCSRRTRRPAVPTNLAAANPTAAADPDLLLATTYGRGQFAINLTPLIVGNAVTVAPTAPGVGPSPPTVTSPITISGTSEISGFGNTTWITVEDVTDPANPTIIAGFNPANGVPIPVPSVEANSTNAMGNFAIPFRPGQLLY